MSGIPSSGNQSNPWVRRVLIIGAITLVVGIIGLITALPSIDDNFRPDTLNKETIEPNENINTNISGMRIYSFYQNVTENGKIEGTVTILQDGKEIELREPTIMSGVGEMEFTDGSKFIPMGWIQVNENTNVNLISNSNTTIYFVDQNQVSEEAFTDPIILTSCISLGVGVCFLSLGLVMFLVRKKNNPIKSVMTLKTPEGDVNVSIGTPTTGGAVLTTDQIYKITKLQEKIGKGELNFQFNIEDKTVTKNVPAPFADRPDDINEINETQKESITKVEKNNQEEKENPSWKDWDEG